MAALASAASALDAASSVCGSLASTSGVYGIRIQSGAIDAGLAELLGVSAAPFLPWDAAAGIVSASSATSS